MLPGTGRVRGSVEPQVNDELRMTNDEWVRLSFVVAGDLLGAGRAKHPYRTDLQVAIREDARCGDPFADVLLERQRIAGPPEVDRRLPPSQKARTPAARFRRVLSLGVSQAELISISTDLEATGDRHRRRVRRRQR